MINYDPSARTFVLSNRFISYVIYVNKKNILQHVYFGKRVDNIDADAVLDFGADWSHTYFDSESGQEKQYEDHYMYDRSLCEVASHGVGDKRGAPVIIRQEDGVHYTDFRYVSHRIYNGKPVPQGLPSSRVSTERCRTLEILLKDVRKDVRLVLSYTVLNDFAGIIRNSTIVNDCNGEIVVKRAYSMELDIPRSDMNLWHFNGDWAHEMKRNVTPVHDGLTRISSNHGRSSHEENPFFMLASRDSTENSGEVYGFSFLYSGNFSVDVFADKWKALRVMQGINDEDFEVRLKNGEHFVMPESFVCYSHSGFGELSRRVHDFTREHILPEKFAKLPQKIILNSWEGCYFDFDTDRICRLIQSAKEWGVQLFCLDDGWFRNRWNDSNGLGDWDIDTEKIDLDKVIRCCQDSDIDFGLWFEPEMVNPGSNLYQAHPEYCIGMPGTENTLWRHQLALDMANDDVVEYVFEKMSGILSKYDIRYVKWDNNKTLTNMYAPSCANQGEAYHKNILGTYKLIRKLQSQFPEVLFEGCASGGGRFDHGMLAYFPQIQGSDELDPLVRLYMQYAYSYGYPLGAVGYHIGGNPLMSFGAKASLSLWGVYGLEIDTTKYGEQERRQVLEINRIYSKYHHDVIVCGDLYRLLSPYDTNYMSMMSVSKDKSKALLVFANLLKESPQYRFIKLEGLDDDTTYRNSYDHKVHSGRYYKTVGLNISRGLTEFECILVEIEQFHSLH